MEEARKEMEETESRQKAFNNVASVRQSQILMVQCLVSLVSLLLSSLLSLCDAF